MEHFVLATGYKNPFLPTSSEFQDSTGIVSRNFRTSLISNGTYIHPSANWTLDVDTERLSSWADTFKKMQSNGVSVPLVSSHDAKDSPEDFLGYVTDMYVDDSGGLSGTVNLRGSKAIEDAQRVSQVSIELEEGFRDGKGVSYGEAISRVALTPNPVVPNQGGFEAIAASRLQTLTLSRGKEHMLNQKDLSRIAALLGDENITSDDALDKLEAKIAEFNSTEELQTKLTASLKQVETLKASSIPTNSNEVLTDRAELYKEQLSALVSGGQITKAESEYWAESGLTNKVLMSARDGEQPDMKKILSVLKDRPAIVEFGTKTGSQSAVLDSKVDNGGFNQEIHNEMLQMAGVNK